MRASKPNLWLCCSYACFFFPDKDLVSEQTCQRKKNKPEEAAACAAGLYNNPCLPGARRARWSPPRHEPRRLFFRHRVKRILAQNVKDWFDLKCVNTFIFLFCNSHRVNGFMSDSRPFQDSCHSLCQSQRQVQAYSILALRNRFYTFDKSVWLWLEQWKPEGRGML